MKLNLVMSGLVLASGVAMALTLSCGCANETPTRSPAYKASESNTSGKLKVYKVRIHYLRFGNTFTEVQNDVVGNISLDLEKNQLLWNQIPLQLVTLSEPMQGQKVFFDGTQLIYITGRSPDRNDAVGLTRGAPVNGQTYIQVCQTPHGSYREFFSYFDQLQFPQNYHGLVASTKYVDGTPIGTGYKFVASIQTTNGQCLLNGKNARFYRSTLKDGSGVIVVDDSKTKLILWPDGNWLCGDPNDSGKQFGGYDGSLKTTYLDLRQQTEQANPNNLATTGTGFFITDDGYLISNYHVVKDAAKVRLLTSAGLIDAKVVQVDAANDLALLKADGRFAPLPIAASRTVNLGGTVATVGFPDIGLQGFAPKLAKGEIASLSGAGDDPRYFQISVPVQPGNSGGALVDDRGNVIGIVSAKLDASAALAASGALPENVNYAVKSSLLLSFLESVPAVSARLKAPVTADRKFEEVVKSAQDAAVLVLVY